MLAAVVRLVLLGAAMAAYYAATPFLFPDAADANIGAGLIAFGVVVLVSFGWAFADGRRRGTAPTVVVWAVVAIGFGALWLLGIATIATDASMTLGERLRLDAFFVVFTAGLVFVPAAVGAALGARTSRAGAHRPGTDG